LLDIYRELKHVDGCEKDELTRAHAQAALGELDCLMRTLLFATPKLEKTIKV
jgi:hypothetical protein